MKRRIGNYTAVAILVAIGIIHPFAVRAAPRARFEAATIKRCTDQPVAESEGGDGAIPESSDRLTIRCWTLATLIRTAYVVFAGGHFNGNNYLVDIVKLPSWGDSELYSVEARAESSPGRDMMNGPLLQALLEDRFALKIHQAMKDEPAYALTVAKGGFKLPPFHGGCTPLDPIHPPNSPVQDPCPRTSPQDIVMNLDIFARFLGTVKPRILDEPVINKTGITGYFHFNMEALLKSAPADGQPAESIFTAVQELGLKLQAIRAPRQYLVVDHVEWPSPN